MQATGMPLVLTDCDIGDETSGCYVILPLKRGSVLLPWARKVKVREGVTVLKPRTKGNLHCRTSGVLCTQRCQSKKHSFRSPEIPYAASASLSCSRFNIANENPLSSRAYETFTKARK